MKILLQFVSTEHALFTPFFRFHRHNLHHYINFFRGIRLAIKEDQLEALQEKLELFVSTRRI